MKPSHIAFVVKQSLEGSNQRATWRDVGVERQHAKGGGFDVALHEQLAVSGRITCTLAKDKAEQGETSVEVGYLGGSPDGRKS